MYERLDAGVACIQYQNYNIAFKMTAFLGLGYTVRMETVVRNARRFESMIDSI